MHVFWADMTRALKTKRMVLAVVGLCVAAILSIWDQLSTLPNESLDPDIFSELLAAALSSDTVLLVAPIAAAVPFTGAFVEDYRGRFLRSLLPRCADRRHYIAARTLTAALAGGIVLAAGAFLVFVLFALVFMPWTGILPESGEAAPIGPDLRSFFGSLLLFFLSGAFWSLAGSALAAASMNRYMGFAGPFILYYVLVILAERYVTQASALNPKQWLAPTEGWGIGVDAVALFVGLLGVALAFTHALLLEKRLQRI